MKLLLALLLTFPFVGRAQECHLKKEVDKFTQQPKWTTGLLNFKQGKNPFSLIIDATASDIDFLFSLSSSGSSLCFNDASTAVVSFDSTRVKLTLHNGGTMNCDGYFHFNFRNTEPVPGNLQRLSAFKVNTIKFTNEKTVTEVSLDADQKKLLQDAIRCIIQEAPTLNKH